MIRPIDETIAVAGQIDAADVAGLADQGVTMIVNNRPDGEEPGQPAGAAIEAAAQAAGIAYRAVPIGSGGFAMSQIEAMAAALEAAADGAGGGRVLAYCRSGARSTYAWALARASRGEPADVLIGKAAAAGYDIAGMRPTLEMLGE